MLYGDKVLPTPFIYLSFPVDIEVAFAVDTKTETDLLLSAKWRFVETKGTSFAVGTSLQLLEVGRLQYVCSGISCIHVPPHVDGFADQVIDHGRVLSKQGTQALSNIDFAVGLERCSPQQAEEPFGPSLDFGNISYSLSPSAETPRTEDWSASVSVFPPSSLPLDDDVLRSSSPRSLRSRR